MEPLDDNENNPIRLWAEIHRLRAEMQGPDGFPTWKEAAIAERAKNVLRRGAVQAAISMLRRDAEQGRAIRGELADELSGELAK
jgi:hypothetical protein